jgi:hypothetical protein
MLPILAILKDSFKIWVKNYTLVYGFLTILFVLTWMLPDQLQASQVGSQKFWLLILALTMVGAALLAGWLNMVAESCTRFYALDTAQREQVSFERGFKLFAAFFPGISQFFIPVFIGLSVQLGVGYAQFRPVVPLWIKLQPLVKKLMTLDFNSTQSVLGMFSVSEKALIEQFSLQWLTASAGYMLFSLAFLLWPAYVVVRGCNPMLAYGYALRQYTRMPVSMALAVLLIVLLGITLYVCMALATLLLTVNAAFVSFLLMFLQLAGVMMMVFITVMLFAYVHQHGDKTPVKTTPSTDADESTPSQDDSRIL